MSTPLDPSSSSLPAAPAAAGARLAGAYELLQELGSGSSGTVYRARLLQPFGGLQPGEEVAIKFLRPELAGDERARARLFAEAEVGSALRHPNVAAIFGIETIELLGLPTTYLVMQYVRGTTLREFMLRSGPPVEDLTRRLGADAAKGLHALHRRGLVHRDVKPENLILTPEGGLKIVDLGLAKPFGTAGGGSSPSPASSRSSGPGLAGSVAYAAPELLRGEPAGPRSDLYALGVVLFEVTTGQHPFADATSPDAMLDAQLNRTPPRPAHLRPRVSPFLEQVLQDLLQKDPAARRHDAADLARLLEQGERSAFWRRHEAQAPVLAASRRLLRMRRPAETRFHDRRRELAQLDDALAAARRGQGRVICITGPEGTGRRRLCDEAMQRWLDAADPPHILGGDADSAFGDGEPFASSLLDVLLRGDAPASPHASQRAATGAQQLLGLGPTDAEALAAVVVGNSTESPEVRADRLAAALLALSGQAAVVVRIDHADDLDTSGRLVVQQLTAAAPRHRLLVLCNTGPEPAIAEGARRLDLLGLDEHSFLDFGRELFRAGEPVDPLLSGAHQVLSGLPGNLIEALEYLVHAGALRGRPGDYHGLAPDAELRPAPSHVARFRSRVLALDPAHRHVLAAAAVLGDRCALDDLAALVGSSELAVLEALSLFRGRIVRAQGGEVSFRHRDFRRALLHALPNDEQQRLHARAAALLEQRGADALVVGMHRSQALDHEGCLAPLLTALDERVRAGSRRTAPRLVGRLAVHLRQVPHTPPFDQHRLTYYLLAGRAHQNAGQLTAAARMFQRADRLAHTLDMLKPSAAARIGLATGELDCGRLLSAIALLETVHDDLARVHDQEADALAAQAHGLHARILLYLGQGGEAGKHAQAALKRLPADNEDLRCHLAIESARIDALRHRFAIAWRTLRGIERAGPVRHLPRARLRFHLYRGQLRAVMGDDDAVQDLRFAIAEADRLRLPVYAARAAVFAGERLFWRGRDDEAAAEFRTAVDRARAGNDRLGEAMARGYLVRFGGDDPALAALVEELAVPLLQANWLLALAGSGRALADTGERLEQLLAAADLPLSLQLRALAALERPASARSLVRAIAERFAARPVRQRFLALWSGGARV